MAKRKLNNLMQAMMENSMKGGMKPMANDMKSMSKGKKGKGSSGKGSKNKGC